MRPDLMLIANASLTEICGDGYRLAFEGPGYSLGEKIEA